MMSKIRLTVLAFASVAVGFYLFSTYSGHDETPLVIYSSRQDHLIRPLLDAFEKESGIKATLFTGKEGQLIERLKTEGDDPRADVFITVDAGNLWYAEQQGLFAAVHSDVLEARIPEQWQDPNNRWFGFSIRARTIIYHKDRVAPADLSSYEALADPKWADRLVLRTSKKVYNQSLVGMMIFKLGKEKTKAIVAGWVANLAAPVFSNDTEVIKSIESGQGDVGLVNTYYFARYQNTHPNTQLALFWPTRSAIGVHANICGAGIVKNARNKANARLFLEWLSGDTAQKMLADSNFEYPVVPNIKLADIVRNWGPFTPSTLPVHNAGHYQADAIQLMTMAGYE